MLPLLAPDVTSNWFKTLPSDRLLSARDVVALFGFASATSLASVVAAGAFPPADDRHFGFASVPRDKQPRYWRVDTLRKELTRRQKHNRALKEKSHAA